jgi:chitinase
VIIGATMVAAIPLQQAHAAAACATAWSSTKVYVQNDTVSYRGSNYTAKWWTQNDIPSESGQWGVWVNGGACEGQGLGKVVRVSGLSGSG